MRLIGGFLHLDGRPAETRRLEAMAAAMTAPGLSPRLAARIDGPLALIMLDFAPTPPNAPTSTGLPQGASGLALAADIRLDEPAEAPDDAGLIALLEGEGEDGLHRLAGDFAFAAWSPNEHSLLCARDGFGVRPLFFAHRPGEAFVFASLPRGLHASGLVPRAVNETFVVDELLLKHGGPETSLFTGVERLAPGGWLRIGGDGRIARGWHWRPDVTSAGRRRVTPEDAAAELSALVRRAVRHRLPATGPVAAHLSGGVDSSAIAILAAPELRPQGRSLLAYSLVPARFGDYGFGGEGPFIAPVLRQEPDIVWSPMRVEDQAAFVLPAMNPDQLMPADPAHPEVRIFAEAAARGAQTLLLGWGGDEGCSYTGRGVLAEALLSGSWGFLAAELRALASAQKRSPLRVAWGELSPYLLPPSLRSALRQSAGRADEPTLPRLMADLLRPDKVAGRDLAFPPMPPDARRIRYDLLSGPGLPRRAEQWALMAARHGMAAAFPLLDRRVVEFALSLPSGLFLRGGWTRRLFRDAMAGILPEELRWKPGKLDIVVEGPLYVATQRSPLRERLAAFRHHSGIAGLFDLDAVEARLHALPPAADLARLLDGATVGGEALGHALSLLRSARVMAFLAENGPDQPV